MTNCIIVVPRVGIIMANKQLIILFMTVYCIFAMLLTLVGYTIFSPVLYSSESFYCSLLFNLLSSSSSYVRVLVCIYCTLTLPPGVNPIAVNRYLSTFQGVGRSKRKRITNCHDIWLTEGQKHSLLLGLKTGTTRTTNFYFN